MAMATSTGAASRLADALLVEDEPAPGRVESVSIAQARSAAAMTDVIIVVIALIVTAFAVALAVLLTELLPVLRAPQATQEERR
jgi:hypothetical protein